MHNTYLQKWVTFIKKNYTSINTGNPNPPCLYLYRIDTNARCIKLKSINVNIILINMKGAFRENKQQNM